MARLRTWVGLLCMSAFVVTGCDQLGMGGSKKKDKSSKSDDDDDDDKGKDEKKKDKKKGKDGDGDKESAKAPAGTTVPNTPGFVVPPGGAYSHMDETFGDKRLVLETYAYPLKDFPRAKLRADLVSIATGAGWTCKPDGDISFLCQKPGGEVAVLVGEAGADETKLNIAVHDAPAAGGGAPAAGGTVYAGTYSSAWGQVTLSQKASDPGKVTGRYPRGTLACTATDPKLDCSWAEPGSPGGHAVFTRDATGNIAGSWGNGASSTAGGPWNLKLVTPGHLE